MDMRSNGTHPYIMQQADNVLWRHTALYTASNTSRAALLKLTVQWGQTWWDVHHAGMQFMWCRSV
jgi:hypothetical protein